jgi:hypothetical protein
MKLVIEDEVGTRTVVPFAGGEITVGRTAEGGCVRLPDRDVSRRHARFLHASGVVIVEDLGSLTGTLVNGERIAGRRRLREGDLIEIGGYDLAVVPDEALAVVAGPGAPPPLPGLAKPPGTPRPPVPARSQGSAPPPVPVVRDVTPTPGFPAPAPSPARAGADRSPALFLLACLAALLLGALAGFAVGAATAPRPPAASAASGK